MAKGANAVVNAVKAHPYLTAGGVVALLLLMRAGSGASSGGTGDYLAAAMQARELSLQGLNASLAAQTEQYKTNAQLQIARDTLAAEMYKVGTEAKAATAIASGEQATNQLLGLLNFRSQQTAARSAETIALAEINASKAVALDNNLTALAAIDKTTQQQATLYSLIAGHEKDMALIDLSKVQTQGQIAAWINQQNWEYGNEALRQQLALDRYAIKKGASTSNFKATLDGITGVIKDLF